jgi:hypothetical protein
MTTPNASSHVTSQRCRGGCRTRMAAERRLEAGGYEVLRWICGDFDEGVLHLC